MLEALFSRKAEIVVKAPSDSGASYTVSVSGSAKAGGNAANYSIDEKQITGELGPGNQDNFIIEGEVTTVEGNVTVETREVISADWTGVFLGIGFFLGLGFVASIYKG